LASAEVAQAAFMAVVQPDLALADSALAALTVAEAAVAFSEEQLDLTWDLQPGPPATANEETITTKATAMTIA
jgi:hypothetical protein